ncbi:Ser/Thr protein kinase RdoA involved in Cpx stress response, MazF antagonist [Nonomuraea maritima]|uniref:Ser/Thr protein kinase RdoA involved in Cpx stress response, MazF antagonist n=1 Tax=Nonomuraea maritima TaxID=683260 RepID=A0A1G8WEP3_9ACTN|nr:aminoglycoside phosphotransferase family protein [Nonomuraea maritima]SDJ76626.1 Ser/Thr protein kinase RdoA involved in Cpx stress response, MazF antagonist [Nonomuraea maritima]
MDSRTKRRLTGAELDALARRALGTGVTAATELTDGLANAVWRLRLSDGREVVLKLSPPPDLDQLSYERDLLRTEAAAIGLALEAGVPVAPLLRAGFDDPELGGDYLFLTALDGVSWNDTTPDDEGEVRRELGRLLARLNGVTGERFGYPYAGIVGATWREAFLAMVAALLGDTERWPTPLPRPAADLMAVFQAAAPVLDEVTTPRLVHFDAWKGNVFLDLSGPPRIQALIDHERAFWGDPLADLVTPTIFGELAEDDPLLAGYREVTPLELTPAALVRLDLYRAYLYLILLVENGPRQYPPDEYARVRDLALSSLDGVLDRLVHASSGTLR